MRWNGPSQQLLLAKVQGVLEAAAKAEHERGLHAMHELLKVETSAGCF
jgi:hypothetical protein